MESIDKKIESYKLEELTTANLQEQEKSFRLFMKDLYAEMKNIPNELKKVAGEKINSFKNKIEEMFAEVKTKVETNKAKAHLMDLTLSKPMLKYGAIHPLNKIFRKFEEYYVRNGFNIASGPEIELDKYNCEMLNMPEHHPARGMQDTFYIKYPNVLLRSHTSAVQVRYMLAHKPPVKIISPGVVYRVDELDPQHTPMFFQLEGLVIGDNVTFADLKGSIMNCLKDVFGDTARARFVPCYYPYTEPSAGIDVSCMVCGGKGCRTCKQTGWIRIGGCGMVHPHVLNNVGYKDVQGFAFGYGMSRLPMIKYKLPELRILHDNNIKIFRKLK